MEENEQPQVNNIDIELKVEKKIDGQKQIAGAIIIAGLLISGAVLLKGGNSKNMPSQVANNNNVENIQLSPITDEDHILGNTRAKVVVVEYSDLECPFCKVFHQTMQQIISTNKNVAWVYRHYPIPELHAQAFNESLATECAWEQGGNTAFWKYTDRIFEITTSNDGLDPQELPKIAESIGLNVDLFNSCLSNGKYIEKINNSISSGVDAGVRGTPKSFILKNGKVIDTIDGAQPLNIVKSKIDKALR
jgi:protein-disulfide isomerase